MEREYILEWFRFADMDLQSAENATTHYPVHKQLICFLCQQSAEKNLKGVLMFYGLEEPPRTHNLDTLCELCVPSDERFLHIKRACNILTVYGVQPRYPHEMEITEADMTNALKYAQQIQSSPPIQAIRQTLEQSSTT